MVLLCLRAISLVKDKNWYWLISAYLVWAISLISLLYCHLYIYDLQTMIQGHVFNCSQCSLSILNSPYSKLTPPSFTSQLIPSSTHFGAFFMALPFIQYIKLETSVCSWFLLFLLIHIQLSTNSYSFNLNIAHIFLLFFIPSSTSLLKSLSI